MTRAEFLQFIRSIFATEDSEILCTEFFDLLPRYVDLELSDQEAATLLPQVKHHLGQCPECDEVYQALLEAARPEDDRR
jgi:predicted anti-sigma-YlaC factor YlaD